MQHGVVTVVDVGSFEPSTVLPGPLEGAPAHPQDTLDLIVRAASRCIPSVEHVGISIAHRTGWIDTRAATDDFVREMDRLQTRLGEGPAALPPTSEPALHVSLAHEQLHWRRLTSREAERDVRSHYVFRVYAEADTAGVLNMYSRSTTAVNGTAWRVGRLLSEHAALVLGRGRPDVPSALHDDAIIGQAVDVLSERHGLDEERAYEYLVRACRPSELRLIDVAREVLGENRLLPSSSSR